MMPDAALRQTGPLPYIGTALQRCDPVVDFFTVALRFVHAALMNRLIARREVRR